MTWLRPWNLLLLLPWLGLLIWLWRHHRQSGRWSRLVAPQLLSALSYQPNPNRHRLGLGALGLAGVLIIVALAGPARPMAGATTLSQGSLVVVLDNTLSMAAEDVMPSRIERARRMVLDWAGSGVFQRTGVVVYSGSAHWLTPFTRDVETLALQLNQLDPFIMPQFGNRPDLAFAAVAEKQQQLAGQRLHVLWLTDDATPDKLSILAGQLQHGGHTWIVPLGTEGGGPIPLPDGRGFLNNADQLVVAKLRRGDFDRAARQLSARLVPLGSEPSSDWLSETQREPSEDRWVREWGYWLLLPAMLLLLPWYRRGLVFMLPLMLIMPPQNAQAQSWIEPLMKNREQRAFEALHQGQAQRSLELTQRPELAGAAAFEQGDYQAAVNYFQQLDSADAHYNRGNALVRLGELEQALGAYQQAIDISGHDSARQNQEKVEEFLRRRQEARDEQKKQQQQGDSSQQDGETQQPDDPSQSEPSPQDQASAAQDGQADPQPPEPDTSDSNEDADPDSNDTPMPETETDTEPAESTAPASRAEQLRDQAVEQLLNKLERPSSTVLQRKLQFELQQAPPEQDESQLW